MSIYRQGKEDCQWRSLWFVLSLKSTFVKFGIENLKQNKQKKNSKNLERALQNVCGTILCVSAALRLKRSV